MRTFWRWLIGIVVGLIIIALIFLGGSTRRAYRTARGAIEQRVNVTQDRIDAWAEMATASVDLAVQLAGNLPSQQAKADLVKQDIDEISKRLKEAADLRGEAALDRLDQSIEQFNATLQAVEDASKEADTPVVKAYLDRIYGILEATKEQLIQALNK